MALFLLKLGASSTLPIMMTMDDTPPKRVSPERLSFFQALMKCEMRSWKSFASIWIASAIATTSADGDIVNRGGSRQV